MTKDLENTSLCCSDSCQSPHRQQPTRSPRPDNPSHSLTDSHALAHSTFHTNPLSVTHFQNLLMLTLKLTHSLVCYMSIFCRAHGYTMPMSRVSARPAPAPTTAPTATTLASPPPPAAKLLQPLPRLLLLLFQIPGITSKKVYLSVNSREFYFKQYAASAPATFKSV